MRFRQLKKGDWFTCPQGGLLIKVEQFDAYNLLTGKLHCFSGKEEVKKEQDRKLFVLFPIKK